MQQEQVGTLASLALTGVPGEPSVQCSQSKVYSVCGPWGTRSKGSPVAPSRLFSKRALMPSDSPSSSLSFWRLSALRLRASALSASVAFAICVDVIALQSPLNCSES